MYVQLLRTALVHRSRSGRSVSTSRLLAETIRSRGRVLEDRGPNRGDGWAPAAIAHEVAYDSALVKLCERLGIGVEVDAFGRPEQERRRLEKALADQGIDLGELTGSTSTDGNAC